MRIHYISNVRRYFNCGYDIRLSRTWSAVYEHTLLKICDSYLAYIASKSEEKNCARRIYIVLLFSDGIHNVVTQSYENNSYN